MPTLLDFAVSVTAAACRTSGLRIDIKVAETRCPQCDYLLYHLQSPNCPECGHGLHAT